MSETKETVKTTVVKGDSENFVKKASAADKKPVKKNTSGKKPISKPKAKPATKEAKVTNESGEQKPNVPTKKPLSRAQIAEKKFGVASTWRPFEAFFKKSEKTDKSK